MTGCYSRTATEGPGGILCPVPLENSAVKVASLTTAPRHRPINVAQYIDVVETVDND